MEPYYEDLNLKTAYGIYQQIIKNKFKDFLRETINKYSNNTKYLFINFVYSNNYLDIDVLEHNEDFDIALNKMKNILGEFGKEDIKQFEKEGWLYYYFDLMCESTEIIPIYPLNNKTNIDYPLTIIYDWNKVSSKMFDKWIDIINNYYNKE